MYKYDDLVKEGLLNTDSVDVRDLITDDDWVKATYCNSTACAGRLDSKRGKLVHTGSAYLDKCTNCGAMQTLYFQEIRKKS